MGFLDRLMGRTAPAPHDPPEEHAVLVRIPLSDDGFGTEAERSAIQAWAGELEAAIEESGSGEYDGDEFGDGECTLYLYGPDADALWASVETVVRRGTRATGGHAMKRYGGPGEETRSVRIELG